MDRVWVVVVSSELPGSCFVLGVFRTAPAVYRALARQNAAVAAAWYPPRSGQHAWQLRAGHYIYIIENVTVQGTADARAEE